MWERKNELVTRESRRRFDTRKIQHYDEDEDEDVEEDVFVLENLSRLGQRETKEKKKQQQKKIMQKIYF